MFSSSSHTSNFPLLLLLLGKGALCSTLRIRFSGIPTPAVTKSGSVSHSSAHQLLYTSHVHSHRNRMSSLKCDFLKQHDTEMRWTGKCATHSINVFLKRHYFPAVNNGWIIKYLSCVVLSPRVTVHVALAMCPLLLPNSQLFFLVWNCPSRTEFM